MDGTVQQHFGRTGDQRGLGHGGQNITHVVLVQLRQLVRGTVHWRGGGGKTKRGERQATTIELETEQQQQN